MKNIQKSGPAEGPEFQCASLLAIHHQSESGIPSCLNVRPLFNHFTLNRR